MECAKELQSLEAVQAFIQALIDDERSDPFVRRELR
jgi:hypothetical protein